MPRPVLVSAMLSSLVFAGCAASVEPEPQPRDDVASTREPLTLLPLVLPLNPTPLFQVGFGDCVEAIGTGLGQTAVVRSMVPSKYTLVGELLPVTPVAIRMAHCSSISVNGQDKGPGSLAQIGPMIVTPDGTGTINNYQLWYYTDIHDLDQAFNAVGVPSQYQPGLNFGYQACGPLVACPFAFDPGDGTPPFTVSGTVTATGVTAAAPLIVNWWHETNAGSVRMQTHGPGYVASVSFGQASITASTPADSDLARILGATTTNFEVDKEFNGVVGGGQDVSVR
jgi:hypothetical protein